MFSKSKIAIAYCTYCSALHEFWAALSSPHLWALLGWYDIRQRYRRSVLGPLWLTLSTGVLIGMLSILWSTLFKQSLKSYLPFFAIGHIIWLFIASQITEACSAFTQFEAIIKQIRLPFPSFILRLLTRNFIVLGHNAIIIVIVAFFCSGWHRTALIAIPGLLLTAFALVSLSLILAILCTRYRDITMIIQNLMLIIFYLTPIMWRPQQLGQSYQWIANYNPIKPFIDITRQPLLGELPAAHDWLNAVSLSILLFSIALAFLAKYRHRIAYWL